MTNIILYNILIIEESKRLDRPDNWVVFSVATIRDVAKLAGVSVATVSAVINKNSGVRVSEELTRRVEKAIKELNYKPNRIARSLSKKENYTIGYIVPSITNFFFPQLAKAIEDIAFEKDYGVYLCNTDGKIARARYYLDSLIENRVAGIITTLTWEIEEIDFIENVLSQNIPVVGLAGARVNGKIDTVRPDDKEGARMAVEYLLGKGYNRIAFIGVKDSQTTVIRLSGYRQALLEAGLGYDEGLVGLASGFANSEIRDIVSKLIRNYPELNAIFVFNDLMGTAVIDALNRAGKKIPEDIAVMGFDDSIAAYTFPRMTTMSIPKVEMASIAMERLFKRINGDDSSPLDIKITPTLVEGNTT